MRNRKTPHQPEVAAEAVVAFYVAFSERSDSALNEAL